MGGSHPYVYALTVYNGQLIAGGNFTTAGGVSTNRIARWDGSNWEALGSGMNYDVRALTVYNGELIAGGWFTTAGGKNSSHWGRWGLPTVYGGDLNHDCGVDEQDLGLFTGQWLRDDCEYTGFCGEADLNYDRKVNFLDYVVLANNWLIGG
jgi:hypothetical protein